ncbi:NIPSNAP family protein [Pseudoxanthomonas dokdonensis]|uniref:NIPSNAP domain-containing protein n=1 Tax=Pseudoxanthomonas dokdonensis TaxID=344882 RepID=A0A0R0CNH6_9GAMM|nr:NIPSNAP family protein [Pseudoxanthomonas dokdonensis]KRG70966.1 hypothetical protein ABB29_03800 [Pseudoxanthomonas dokdonensis]
MTITARFTYRIQPGRMDEFVAKLKAAADARFNSAVMPQAFRFYVDALPGQDADIVILDIDYASLADFGARTDFEQNNPEWAALWGPQPDAPEQLLGVDILKSINPFA